MKPNPTNPYSTVQYLIFELAEGDVRKFLDLSDKLDNVFAMRSMHNIAVGLNQLHRADIAHQDLKPSNVLVFDSGKVSKVCDLGRAWDKSTPAPHDRLRVAGDMNYAPINQLYNHETEPTIAEKRFGCDMFHLGNILFFMYTRLHVNAIMMDGLALPHRPNFWRGTYDEVLPYLQASFELAVSEFSERLPNCLRQELRTAFIHLCNPDIKRRGHPLNFGKNRFGLERFISMFDKLAHVARLDLVRGSLNGRIHQ